MTSEVAYRILLRAADDIEYVSEFEKNPDSFFQNEDLTAEEIGYLKYFFNIINYNNLYSKDYYEQQKKQYNNTLDLIKSFQDGLKNTLTQIEEAYKKTMTMYEISFYLGVVLIIAAIIMAFLNYKPLISVVFGGLGITDFIAYFITKPPQNLQESRSDLAQLQTAFFNWFDDSNRWDYFLSQLYSQQKLDYTSVKNISDAKMNNTEKTMKLIENYCSFTNRTKKSNL